MMLSAVDGPTWTKRGSRAWSGGTIHGCRSWSGGTIGSVTAHWHVLSLINHGDVSYGGDIDEWDWRNVSEDDDQGDDDYCMH